MTLLLPVQAAERDRSAGETVGRAPDGHGNRDGAKAAHALRGQPVPPGTTALGSRARDSVCPLAGLAAIAALLPLRHYWVVDVVLVCLVFTVPGVIALRALRVPAAAVAAYPVYIPAAALLVVTFGGLLADLVGPSIGVARPLSGDATALAALVIALVLWLLGLGARSGPMLPWRSLLATPTLLLPLALPAAAGCGALLLSNGDGPLVARAAAVVTIVSLVGCLLFAGRLSTAQVGMLLFACALAAEWAFSIRSQEVVGYDIANEIQIARHTQAVGIWRTLHRNDAYGAMLSITVLPSALAALTGSSPLVAFKVLYPVLTALIPVSVFLVAGRVMRRSFAAGAGALLIAQNYFFALLPQLARQEIALLFFAVLVGAMFDARVRTLPRLALITALSAGMVVSHYSSTYVAIPAIIIAFDLQAVLSLFRRVPPLSTQFLCAAAVLFGGAALWYGAITHSSSNLTSFNAALGQNGLQLLPNAKGNILTSYLSGNAPQSVSASDFQQLAAREYRARSYVHPLPGSAQRQFRLRPASIPAAKGPLPRLAGPLEAASIIAGQLLLLFAGVGTLLMLVARSGTPVVRQIGCLAGGMVAILVVIRFSGTVAADYNQTRALAQSLIVLAVPAAWFGDTLVRHLGGFRVPASALLGLGIAFVMAYQSGVTALLTGGGTSLNLSQGGEDFERQYMTPAELAGAAWASGAAHGQLLYSDRYGELRLAAATSATAFTPVTPQTLDRYAWVYGTRTNVVLGRARDQIGNDDATYRWPARFLHFYSNTVYSNGESAVYHR